METLGLILLLQASCLSFLFRPQACKHVLNSKALIPLESVGRHMLKATQMPCVCRIRTLDWRFFWVGVGVCLTLCLYST